MFAEFRSLTAPERAGAAAWAAGRSEVERALAAPRRKARHSGVPRPLRWQKSRIVAAGLGLAVAPRPRASDRRGGSAAALLELLGFSPASLVRLSRFSADSAAAGSVSSGV
jgi:hypothetical protein